MATLVFSALGTIVGGPVGGAVGALIGRAADSAIIGSPVREGARLTELAVSSSSYGQPIARLFGATRAAGTIVWATDLQESSETSGGGKGQPRTRQYSYSISFAVALSSRPIMGVGRIWADGNLLRGAAGDLKTGGTLRIHLGHRDQAPDPLLAAALGAQCPAHRGLAYAVFEDLQLADFGNRIPALSFEVFATGAGEALVPALVEAATAPVGGAPAPGAGAIAGFSQDGGSLTQALDLLGQVVPLAADVDGAGLTVGPQAVGDARVLPPPIAWPEGEFGSRTGARRSRGASEGPSALRYYDSARDYQPGLQRAAGRARLGGERTLELPATLSADGAGALIDAVRLRADAQGERMQLRVAAVDPVVAPGRLVALPGEGAWRVVAWEWRSGGVELELQRLAQTVSAAPARDPGSPWSPADRLPAATLLDAFELPWDGAGAADAARVHAALGAGAGRWAGAALYVERAGALHPIGTAGPLRAVTGRLAEPLAGSPAIMFEPSAWLEVRCDNPDAAFLSTDGAAFAAGANRLLVGEEIVQFMQATLVGGGRWRLSGLLRGRGATEAEAKAGHATDARVCLLDDRLQLLDGAAFDAATERLAAIGNADPEPVFAEVRAPGRSRRPLAPVHAVAIETPDGGVMLEWTRRARGAWAWSDGAETPLVEEAERYEVGAGASDVPSAVWPVGTTALTLTAGDLAALAPGTLLWVRQVGSHGRSPVLPLHVLS